MVKVLPAGTWTLPTTRWTSLLIHSGPLEPPMPSKMSPDQVAGASRSSNTSSRRRGKQGLAGAGADLARRAVVKGSHRFRATTSPRRRTNRERRLNGEHADRGYTRRAKDLTKNGNGYQARPSALAA